MTMDRALPLRPALVRPMRLAVCMVCGQDTREPTCCGERVNRGPFRMTKLRVRALRAFAHGRKGLDADTYRMRLEAVGVRSTLELNADQYHRLMLGLRSLPDAPAKPKGRAPR